MIQIKDTKNKIGITIHGDYNDLNELYDALSRYLRFYFNHQDAPGSYSCYECLLGLNYDIRHAYQGDRNYESVNNNAENISLLASCIYEMDKASLKKTRNKYKNGNLYFNVEVLYPWAIYYLYTLQAVTDDIYQNEWFIDNEFSYTEYQAESDLALIRHFIQLLWNKLNELLPDDVMKTVWDYTRLYNHVEYYFAYPETYMIWLCNYWVNVPADSIQRMDLLSLIALELSSIQEEDPDELEESIIEENCTHNKNASATNEDVSKSAKTELYEVNSSEDDDSEATHMENDFNQFRASLAKDILNGLDLYDEYAYFFYHYAKVPYQGMAEFLENIFEYVDENGPFDEARYEAWLEQQLGAIDWGRMEW